MPSTQLRLFTGFYVNPARTASELLDEGSWWAALLLAVLMCLPFAVLASGQVPPEEAARGAVHGVMAVRFGSSPLQALMLLGAFCVPALICAGTWAGRHIGSFGVLLRRDYGSAFTGVLMAFAASHVPFALAGVWLMRQPAGAQVAHLDLVGYVWIACLVLFAVFVSFVARAHWGLTYGSSLLCAATGLAAMAGGLWAYPAIRPVFWMLTSPCLLFYLWSASQGDLMAIGNAFRGRGNLRRRLEAAAINPHDADAQYQIGLLLSQRRQYAEARQRFEQAIKIDRDFAEAHFELGRIAREEQRLPEAIEHLGRAVALNDKLQLSDVWREIGATYLAAGQMEDAEAALRKFVGRREHDPEGLYLLGEVLAKSEPAEAQALYARAVESANAAPPHRRREVRHWANLARKRLRG